MTPIQKSTLEKTTLECLAFGSIACLANTRYFVQYLPNLPKNGALLSGGAFILSSFIYNILRANPERSSSRTLLEKQILFFGASSILMYAAKITPRQAAGLGLATWLFSACVHRITDLSSLEKTHYSYTKHFERGFNMIEKNRFELYREFFQADLPPIPGKVEYPCDKTLLSKKEMERLYKNPETFTRNQLGWIAQSMRFGINEESLRLLNYLFDSKIPIQNIASIDKDNEGCKAFAQKLVAHDPLYYYAYKDTFAFIKDDTPDLSNLTKSLTPASIKRMAPHTLTLWARCFENNAGIEQSLCSYIRIAFSEQFWALNLKGIDEDRLRNQLLKNYQNENREELSWCLFSLERSEEPIEIHNWVVPALHKAKALGLKLPWFRVIDQQVDINMLHKIYSKYPLYQFLETDADDPLELHARFQQELSQEEELSLQSQGNLSPHLINQQEGLPQGGEKLSSLPTFSSLVKGLTIGSIEALSLHDLRVWIKVFERNEERWDLLDTRAQLAFLKRYKEEFSGQELPKGINLKKIQQDLANFPEEFCRSDIEIYFECLKKENKITVDTAHLRLLKRAKDLKMAIPPFVFKKFKNFPITSENGKLLTELYQAYPLFCLLTGEEAKDFINARMISSLLSDAAPQYNMTPLSIKGLRKEEFKGYCKVFQEKERWDYLPTHAQIAFLKRHQEENPDESIEAFKTEWIIWDAVLNPNKFSKEEIAFVFELLTENCKLKLTSLFLPLLIRAKNLKVDLPPTVSIEDDRDSPLYGNSRNADHLVELFRAYPRLQLMNKNETVQEILKGAQPPLPTTLDAIAKALTPSIVKTMSKEEFASWHKGIQENPIAWDSFRPEIQTAFLKRFIELDLPHIPLHTMPQDRSWVTLTEENTRGVSENQARWYLNLYGIRRPCFEANPFEDATINRLGKILRKCCHEYTYGLIVPILYNPEREYGLKQDVIRALITKGFSKNPTTVESKEAAKYHILTRAPENAFLIKDEQQKKLTFEEELFLRHQFLDKTVLPLTTRYVEHLERNSEEAKQVAECYSKMGNCQQQYVEVNKLPEGYRYRAQRLLKQ